MNAKQPTSQRLLTSNMTASIPPSLTPRKTKTEFPIKVYAMLELAENITEFAQAVAWLPHGRAFMIHNKVKFMKEVVPLFFNQTKIRSFNRQLHLWGYRRRGRGDDQVWYHDNFLRGKPEDMRHMVRTKIKGNSGGSSIEDMRVPNFNALPPIPVCDKYPVAILNIMESVILKLQNTFGGSALCGAAMPTISHPHHRNVNTGSSHEMMVLQRTETFQPPSPPNFHRSVTNESRFMMQPYVPAMPSMNHHLHLPQQVNHIKPSPAEHQTSGHEPHRSEESQHILQDRFDFSLNSLQHNDDFEPLPFMAMDDITPCDEFASFIEGAIQQVGVSSIA